MSEAPLLTPLTLLGDFVTKVGKAPDKEALTTYFARLREQVWYFFLLLRGSLRVSLRVRIETWVTDTLKSQNVWCIVQCGNIEEKQDGY